MNLTELAKIAGVSPATASKALKYSDEISADTRAQILKLAEESGYLTDRKSRRLSGRQSEDFLICLVLPEIRSEYYMKLAEEFNDCFRDRSVILTVTTHEFKSDLARRRIRGLMRAASIDGFIFVDLPEMTDDIRPAGVPAVSVTNAADAETSKCDTLTINYRSGANQAIGYLQSMGHDKIAFIGEKLTLDKELAFRRALVDPAHIIHAESRFEYAGYEGFSAISQLPDKPTAVVCAYDYIAFGLIKAARSAGWRIPEELSVIGFDDIAEASREEIGLTTVKTHCRSLCSLASELLMKKVTNPAYTVTQHISIDTELVIRGTVAEHRRASESLD